MNFTSSNKNDTKIMKTLEITATESVKVTRTINLPLFVVKKATYLTFREYVAFLENGKSITVLTGGHNETPSIYVQPCESTLNRIDFAAYENCPEEDFYRALAEAKYTITTVSGIEEHTLKQNEKWLQEDRAAEYTEDTRRDHIAETETVNGW